MGTSSQLHPQPVVVMTHRIELQQQQHQQQQHQAQPPQPEYISFGQPLFFPTNCKPNLTFFFAAIYILYIILIFRDGGDDNLSVFMKDVDIMMIMGAPDGCTLDPSPAAAAGELFILSPSVLADCSLPGRSY